MPPKTDKLSGELPVHEIVALEFFAANCQKCPYLEGSEPIVDQMIRDYCRVANALPREWYSNPKSATPNTVKSELEGPESNHPQSVKQESLSNVE